MGQKVQIMLLCDLERRRDAGLRSHLGTCTLTTLWPDPDRG